MINKSAKYYYRNGGELKVPDERKNGSIHVQVWLIPIFLTLVTSLLIGAMTWQSFKEGVSRADDAESKNAPIREQVKVNTKIIETLGTVTQDTNSKLEKFVERYDKNREDDQRMFREILVAVRK